MYTDAIQRLQTLRVSDVMSRTVVNVSASSTMASVAKQFSDHGVSSAPVVDEQGRCVGILSASDFVRRESTHAANRGAVSAGESRELAEEFDGGLLQIEAGPKDSAADYMSTAVQAVSRDAPLLIAAKMMCADHIHRLPVLDADERPTGVISTMDIVAALLGAIDEVKSSSG